MLGAEKNLFSVLHWPAIAPRCPTAVIAGKIKHTFSKREQTSFSFSHKDPALMQPVCTAISTPCHAGRGLAGHLRCVSAGYSLQFARRPPHFCGESAGKRSHRNRSSSPERVRLLQPLLPRPQKIWRPVTYSRSQTPELCPDERVIQDDHFETYA